MAMVIENPLHRNSVPFAMRFDGREKFDFPNKVCTARVWTVFRG